MYDKSKEGKIIENIEYSNPHSVLNKYMYDKKCLWKLQPLVWISERKTRPHKTYMHLSVFHLIQPKSFSELLAWGGTRYILFVSKDDQWYPAEVVLFQDTWGQIITGLGELCFVIAIHNKKYSCKQSYEIIMTHYLLHYLYLKIQFDIKRLNVGKFFFTSVMIECSCILINIYRIRCSLDSNNIFYFWNCTLSLYILPAIDLSVGLASHLKARVRGASIMVVSCPHLQNPI